MATVYSDPTKPTPFSKYLEEKRKLTEAAEQNPGLKIDTSPKRIVQQQKAPNAPKTNYDGMQTFRSNKSLGLAPKGGTFNERVQERLNTAKSEGSQVGITFYDQGQPANPNAAHPKTGRGALPAVQSSELVEAASELAAAAKKLATTQSKPKPHVTRPCTPLTPLPGVTGAAAAPKTPQSEKPGSGSMPAHTPHADSIRPFTGNSARLNQKVSAPKFSPVSPGLILAQQSTATRSGSTGGLPPPSAGGSIIHAMNASRAGTAQSRPASGQSGQAMTSRPGSRNPNENKTPANAKVVELMAEKMKKLQLAGLAKNGVLTEEEYQDHLRRTNFNNVVTKLKEKINVNGHGTFGTHFSQLDVSGDGVLQPSEFKAALQELNLGCVIDDFIFRSLLESADIDCNKAIDYNEFAQAIRLGNISYLPLNPNIRTKTLPDPDNPFGDPDNTKNLPFGIQSDAMSNIKAFEARVDNMYKSLEETFLEFDSDESGEVDFKEFRSAMEKLREEKGVHLGDNEILQLFKHADYDHSGAINWQEFVQSFQGGGGRRFIPEFLKPKSMRCSMLGAPWEWRAEPLDGLREAPRAKLFKVTSKPASSRRRLGLTDKR